MSVWTTEAIPSLTGRCVVLTGGNAGVGFETARQLVRNGASVLIGCRDQERGSAAVTKLKEECANGGSAELGALDLASLASVRSFAESVTKRGRQIDLLINNAGVVELPRRVTEDGFESHFGINHLGHFALTGHLLSTLAPHARVINLGSLYHRDRTLDFADLQSEQKYSPRVAYGKSKLAILMFTYELARRLETSGLSTKAVACHPGFAISESQVKGPRMAGSKFAEFMATSMAALLAQPTAHGAWPTIYAATSPDVKNGDYIGPGGFMELKGTPKKVRSSEASYDIESARELWSRSEALTGVKYQFVAPAKNPVLSA